MAGKAGAKGTTARGDANTFRLAAPQGEWVSRFQSSLLEWYRREQRRLPWRETRDPYRIWVSEAMLQQTRVETVIPYYDRFLQRFPTAAALAAAPEEEVLKAWEGLGYYSRARNLQSAAREVESLYGGRVPEDPAAFRALPGVGNYTVGAVLSIAYGQPLPAVDGNVARVFSRLLLLREEPERPRVRRALEAFVGGLIPAGEAGDFNQALMELGALVCLPRGPRCGACPVSSLCLAREAGEQESLPVRRSRASVPTVRLASAVVCQDGRLLVRRRPASGLLAGLWEFPNWATVGDEAPEDALARGLAQLALTVSRAGEPLRVQHAFSHRRWDLLAYWCPAAAGVARVDPPVAGCRWVSPAELVQLALPVPMAAIAAAFSSRCGQSGSFPGR